MSSNNDAPPSATTAPMPPAKVTVRDLAVARDGRTVLSIDALDVPAGRVTAVIGPNGSGKSTFLAALQLLIKPQRGELLLDGAPMWRDVIATRRRLASAFQEPLLLNTSVLKNLETALGLRKVPRKDRRPRAHHWLARFGVDRLAGRHARDLSGGEAQRVSLARAFSLEPEVLLLDEPFSALDAPTRAALIDDFAGIVRDTAVTTILVTHDRDEALRLGDRVVVLIEGRVCQVGSPQEVFAAPADEEVATFVGVENVWPAQLCDSGQGVATYSVAGHRLDVATDDPAPAALFCVRPEEVTIHAANDLSVGKDSARNHLLAVVQAIDPAGPLVRLRLRLLDGGGRAEAGSSGRETTQPGGARRGVVEASARRGPSRTPETAAPTLVATVTRPSLESLGLTVGSHVIATFKATAAHVIPHAPDAAAK